MVNITKDTIKNNKKKKQNPVVDGNKQDNKKCKLSNDQDCIKNNLNDNVEDILSKYNYEDQFYDTIEPIQRHNEFQNDNNKKNVTQDDNNDDIDFFDLP
jgi:hypothetical protein